MMGLIRAFTGLFFPNFSARIFDADEEPVAPIAREDKISILAIDDDPAFLDGIRELLGVAGYHVLTSTTGPKGLDMLRYAPREIAAVLLDFSMPSFNGAQTVQFVRKLNPAVKVIGLTGLAPEELPADYRQGVDALLLKPFEAAELIATLRKVIGSPAAQPVG